MDKIVDFVMDFTIKVVDEVYGALGDVREILHSTWFSGDDS